MNALVNKVIGLWRGATGDLAEVVYEGGNEGGLEKWIAVQSLIAPCINYQTEIELQDGRRVSLPANEIAHILPDRTGVLVLFSKSLASFDSAEELIHCAPPDNAAVFNADGSLRFQLKNPAGKNGSFRAVVSLSLADGTRGLGVRACPKDWPACEDVYVVDGSTDDLSRQIPRWVRD